MQFLLCLFSLLLHAMSFSKFFFRSLSNPLSYLHLPTKSLTTEHVVFSQSPNNKNHLPIKPSETSLNHFNLARACWLVSSLAYLLNQLTKRTKQRTIRFIGSVYRSFQFIVYYYNILTTLLHLSPRVAEAAVTETLINKRNRRSIGKQTNP